MNPNTFQPIGSAAARVVHYLSPRRNRDLERGRRAADAARRAPGASAMATALAQIDATFDDAAVINALKMRVERFMGLGADHPAVRARYGALSEMIRERSAAWEQANSLAAGPLGFSPHPDTALTIAINLVERWYRDERKAFQLGSVFGPMNPRSRLSVDVLAELRLILRLIRATRPRAYRDVLAVVRGMSPATVAAE